MHGFRAFYGMPTMGSGPARGPLCSAFLQQKEKPHRRFKILLRGICRQLSDMTSAVSGSKDALAKTHSMAKQKFRPTRLGVFSGVKAYIWYVEVLKKRHNAVGRTFCDAIKTTSTKILTHLVTRASRQKSVRSIGYRGPGYAEKWCGRKNHRETRLHPQYAPSFLLHHRAGIVRHRAY